MITMLLGGLWHGAGWTFVIWGGLHGIYLVVNHGWVALHKRLGGEARETWIRRWATRLLTFLAVVLAWVFFRADSLEAAFGVLRGMFGLNGIVLPITWAPNLGALGEWLTVHHVRFESMPLFGGKRQVGLLLLLLGIVWFVPNTQQLMGSVRIALGEVPRPGGFWGRYAWQPTLGFALVIAGILSASLLTMYFSASSEFIYYNF